MPNIMKAKKKPVQTISLEDMVKELGLNLDEVLTPKNEVVEVYEPPPRKEGEMVKSIDELLGKLKEKGLVAWSIILIMYVMNEDVERREVMIHYFFIDESKRAGRL